MVKLVILFDVCLNRLAEEDFHTDKGKECAANRIDNISDETLIMESGWCA